MDLVNSVGHDLWQPDPGRIRFPLRFDDDVRTTGEVMEHSPDDIEFYKKLHVDPQRYGNGSYAQEETGFYTFCYHNDVCISVDIIYLDKISLIRWLHHRHNRAVNTVLMLLEHTPVSENYIAK